MNKEFIAIGFIILIILILGPMQDFNKYLKIKKGELELTCLFGKEYKKIDTSNIHTLQNNTWYFKDGSISRFCFSSEVIQNP